MCKVSILVPIYNVEKYLRQCLDSIVNQTLKDIEIICINDGSTDNSPKIIDEFAQKDNRIKVINKSNTGYGHSMNQGLKAATGEYIGIIESDDFADPYMFETLYNKAKETNAQIVRSNHFDQAGPHFRLAEVLKLDGYDKIFCPRRDNPDFFSRQVAVWSGIYQRDFLINNGVAFNETPGASYQDISFAFKAFSCADHVLLLKDAFVHYRVDNPNSSVKSNQKVYCIFDEFAAIEHFLEERPDLKDPCRYIFEAQIKFVRCDYHFLRISDEFKFAFFQRMLDEFNSDSASGYLNQNFWSTDKWQNLQSLLTETKNYFYQKCRQIDYVRTFRSNFISKLQQFRKIYVYGAGHVAKFMLLELARRQIPVAGAVVEDPSNNPPDVDGIPVGTLHSFGVDPKTDGLLLAISEKTQPPVLYSLVANGYQNIVLITPDLRRSLSLYFV